MAYPEPTLPFLILAGAVGACIGSFLSMATWRLPRDITVGMDRSRCPHCGEVIPAWLNLPLAGFLLARGRCHSCKARISLRYPAIEAAATALFVLVAATATSWAVLTAGIVLMCALLAVFVTDTELYLIPDAFTVPATLAGIGCAFWMGGSGALLHALIAVALIMASFLLLRWGSFRLLGKEALGDGDAFLMAMIGAFMGWEKSVLVVFFGSALGILAYLLPPVRRRLTDGKLPFGTFLALAAAVVYFEGAAILRAYFAWAGL